MNDGSDTTKAPHRKVRTGTAARDAKDKTVVVMVTRQAAHPRYGKLVRTSKRYYAHDPENSVRRGDVVRIVECRPLSKTKRWRVQTIVERSTLAAKA